MGFWKALGKGAVWLVKAAWQNPEMVQSIVTAARKKGDK